MQYSGFCDRVTFGAFSPNVCSKNLLVFSFHYIKISLQESKGFFSLSVVLLGFGSSPRSPLKEFRLELCLVLCF